MGKSHYGSLGIPVVKGRRGGIFGYTQSMISPEPLPQPFIPLTASSESLETIGGKALNLAILAQAQFPVPNGFFIPTTVYRDFVRQNGLDEAIQTALKDVNFNSAAALNTASDTIRSQFKTGHLPAGFNSGLEIAWRWLGAGPVAVRSSATAEDLPHLSFAGQQDTFLNIIGPESLAKAVIECWSSLWTGRAIGYRARNQIPHENVALCVVVQTMAPAAAAGVLFTANPLTGKRAETVIDATLGLGEALVSGQVEPDHYIVSNGSIQHKSLGSKAVILTSNPSGGLQTENTNASVQQAIPDEIILRLAKIGKKIEAHYGTPQDIEWAWHPGKTPAAPISEISILQSRAITSLFPLPTDLPSHPLKMMLGLHLVQGVIEPYSPLGQDIIRMFLIGGASRFGLNYTLENQTAFYIAAERIWINITWLIRTRIGQKIYPKGIKMIDPGVALAINEVIQQPDFDIDPKAIRTSTVVRGLKFGLPFIGRVLLTFLRPEKRRDAAFSRFDQRIQTTQNQIRATHTVWEDFASRVEIIQQVSRAFPDDIIPLGLPPIVAGMASFFGILERFAHQLAASTGNERFKTIHLEITRGLPHNVTTEMDLALWETAQAIRQDPASSALFAAETPENLASRYQNRAFSPQAQTAVDQFIDAYGSRGVGEIDIGRPRWRENPEHIIQVIQSYLQIEDPTLAPDAVFRRGAAAAQQAARDLENAIRNEPFGAVKARLVRLAVKRYRALAGLREAPKFFMIRLMGIIRAGLLQSGADLTGQGLLARSDDLFFLNLRELTDLATLARAKEQTAPAKWEAEWQTTREKVAARRQTRQFELQRRQIPRLLLSDGTTIYEGIVAAPEDQDAIMGDPVSPGVVEGVVKVVLDPKETRLEPGEILVCAGTDPAWTPLFLAAGGLITEVGGMMTHGSVVAREYGIPAVVGVDQATTRLKTGDRIRLDGSRGVIEML